MTLAKVQAWLKTGWLVFFFHIPLGQAASNLLWQPAPGFRAAPLSPAGESPPGFTQFSASNTGILFTNRLAVRQMMDNNNLMNGSGVAAGDFDGDGWCDLYFCAIDGTNALYRNLGDWRFADLTETAGVGMAGLHSTGAVWADIDGDGRLDLLVATLGSGVHLFRNLGSGQFQEVTAEAGLGSATGSTTLALADVEGNGTLDLYVANYGAISLLRSGGRAEVKRVNGQWIVLGPNAQRLRYVDGRLEELGEPDTLYLSDGQGHFRPVPWNSNYFLDEDGKPMAPPLDFGLTVQIRDLNGDGSPDIYVCNDFKTPDRIWINDGTGHFRALPRLAMRKQSYSSMGVDFADLDRDGCLDFFTTEMLGREHGRRIREMVTLAPVIPVPGKIDDRPEAARNTLFRNRGDGTYAEMAWFAGIAASDWSWQPVFLDVDFDGFDDLLIGNGTPFDVQDRDTMSRIRSLGKQTLEQSRTNLALYPAYLTPNGAWRNHHDLTFREVSRAWGFDSTQVSQGIALADLDHDGALDVIINCLNGGPLIYRNRGSAPRLAVRLRGKSPNTQGIGALIRVRGGPVRVQMQEVLAGGRYLSSDEPLRVFAADSPTNLLSIEVVWRSGATSTVARAQSSHIYEIEESATLPSPLTRNFNPEPRPLFREINPPLGHVHQEEFFADFARQPLLMRQFSQLGPGVGWFDLDHDGHDELVIGTGKGGPLSVYHYEHGKLDLMTHSAAWIAPDDVGGLAAWTDPDGRRSLLCAVANYESGKSSSNAWIAISLPGPNGAPEIASGAPAWDASPGPLAVADIDGDGRLELFVGGRVVPGAYPQAARSAIFRWRDGALVLDSKNDTALNSVGLVSGAVWSDLDADGFPELILACEWGPLKVFHNDHGRLNEVTAQLGLDSTTGWWNGVTTGDLDGDGRLDIVASNWGLNDVYQASAPQPLHLYFGRLGEADTMDLIETEYAPELRAVAPRRSLGALGRALPVLLSHFPTHEAFGQATLENILALLPQKPEARFATTLASTLFLNRASNSVAVPLPVEAQLAPAFSVNIADLDGDGCEDVFLSQNFFAVRPELNRLDAGRGLWLRGDGQGGVSAVSGAQAGIQVYGEQRGAALGDFNEDGRIDLAVTQNGAATRVYENVEGRPGLRVRLSGPAGNPFGIGAIIRLEFAARLGPAREIHAGSGYWSQDSLVPVLACPEPPRRIRILWPGGKITESRISGACQEISVDTAGGLRVVR